MKPQHDSDHLEASLQILAAIGYEVDHKTTYDHTAIFERYSVAGKVAYDHW